MLPDKSKSSLGLEYFCSEGDELWTMSDGDLIALGKTELERIGLGKAADVEDGCVFRVPKSYPVYDSDYKQYLGTVRQYVDGLENFQTIGRNGLHRYNNQDHAMLTGMLAVRNLMRGQRNDLWNVNTEQEYHEEVRATVEEKAEELAGAVQGVLAGAFLKLDRRSFGLAWGAVCGLALLVATFLLLLKGGEVVGPKLSLLGQFFPGYEVSWIGSVIGLGWGFVFGFLGGWTVAFLRNTVVFLYMAAVHRRSEYQLLRKLLEHL